MVSWWFEKQWRLQEGLLNSALISVNLSQDDWRLEGLEVVKGVRGKDWAMLKLDGSAIDGYVCN